MAKLLILDIDETLIHADYNLSDYDFTVDNGNIKVKKRPHLDLFLNDLQDLDFDIAFWSSGSDDYVNEIVNKIYSNKYKTPLFIWGRSRCSLKYLIKNDSLSYFSDYRAEPTYVKKLSKVKNKFNIKLQNMLIVDDSPEKCIENYGNHIYINPFIDNNHDNSLLKLHSYLIYLEDKDNYRIIEKRGWINKM